LKFIYSEQGNFIGVQSFLPFDMEPEIREFLKKVSYSIGVAFVWLAITCVAAIKGDNAFIKDHLTLGNILFYTWFAISVVLLAIALRKIWISKPGPAE
jgi:hypothetical protein